MVILDTDLLIGLMRGDEKAISKIKEIEQQNKPMSITSISSYELFKGAYLSFNPTKNLLQVVQLLHNINILTFDLNASKISARIYAFLKNRGALTSLMDQMIASITISKNKTLITRNTKHYQNIHNLRMEKW